MALALRLLGIGGQDAGPALEQHHRRLTRIDVPEIARQGVSPQLGDCGGHLDAGRAAANHHEREMRVTPGGVGLTLSLLEGEEHALPDIEGVVQGLEPRGEWCPRLVLAVVGRDDSRSQNQVVVLHATTIGQQYLLLRRQDPVDVGQDDLGVGLPPKGAANRRGDVGRIEGGAGHLVEHRLEQVVVVPVDDGDADGRRAQFAGSVHAAEAGAHDYHVGKLVSHDLENSRQSAVGSRPYRCIVSRRQRAKRIDVLSWGNSGFVSIGGVHAPAEIGLVGQGKKGKAGEPAAAAKGPGSPQQVDGETGIDQAAKRERGGKGGPTAGVATLPALVWSTLCGGHEQTR